ncbi:MAG TPA: MAPEG family protein [Polyangiaceae bacterium]
MTHPSLYALLGFVVWTMLVVVVGIGTPRLSAIWARRAPPKSFLADVPHGSDRYRRTMRAHANCVENLPIFAALVLIARAVSLESGVFEALAVTVLPARVGQTLTHVASGSNRAVVVRFLFFTVQLLCFAAMTVILVSG